jgi:hypothetical protein
MFLKFFTKKNSKTKILMFLSKKLFKLSWNSLRNLSNSQLEYPLMPLVKQFSEDLDVFSSTIKKWNKSSQMALLVRIDAYHTLLYSWQFISLWESFLCYYWELYAYMTMRSSIIYRLLIDNFHINCRGFRTVWFYHVKRKIFTDLLVINVLYHFRSLNRPLTKNLYWLILSEKR